MDKELLDLLNEARQAGANESQLDSIVDAYNQKKKNLSNTGGGKQIDVLEEPLSDLSVGANGQLQQPVPSISPLPKSTETTTAFDLPIAKKPVVNVAGVNVPLSADLTAPIPFATDAPYDQNALANGLQQRINTKTYNPDDVAIVAQSMKVSPSAANAYMEGNIGTGTVIHFNDIKKTKQDQLKATIDKANKELGLSDSYEEIFATPELASAYIEKIQNIYSAKAKDEAFTSLKTAMAENPTLFALGSITPDNTKRNESLNAAQKLKSIVGNEIIDQISNDTTLNTDQKVKKIYSLVDARDKANVENAIGKRLSPLRYMVDVATGGNTTEDIDLLNANKAGIEFKVNQTLQDKLNYNTAMQKSIAEEYAAKVNSQEISAEDEKAKEDYAKRIADLDAENTHISTQIVPNTTLYDKYPTLRRTAITNTVNEYNAIKSGNVVGYEDGGYEDVTLAEHLSAKGFDKNDQLVKDVVSGNTLKDYSFFGSPIQTIANVFTSTAKGIADLTPLRDEATILAEKKESELFPTTIGANDEFQLTSGTKIAQNISNTTAQVLGQGLLQWGTAGIGRLAGLTKVAAANTAFFTSGSLVSYDSHLKESYDLPIDTDAGRVAYAGINSIFEGAIEKLFPESKIFQVPGFKDAAVQIASKLSAGKLTDKLATELLTKAKNSAVNYLVKYGENIGKESAEEGLTSAFNSATKILVGDPNTNIEKAITDVKNTVIQTAIGTALIGGVGAHRDIQMERNVSPMSTIYNAAIYHDEALDAINLGFEGGLYDTYERDAKVAVLNTARQSVDILNKTEKIEGKELKRPERELYVANLTVEATLTAQKKGMDEVGQKAIDEKVANLQNQRQQILKGEVLIDDNGNITAPTTEPIKSEEPATEIQKTETPPLESTETGIVVEQPQFIPEPIFPDGTSTNIVVDKPKTIPEPITIGSNEETKTTPEVKTEPLPSTVKSEEVKDIIKLKNGEELSVILSDKTKEGDYFEIAINDKDGNIIATASFALNKENNKYTPIAVEITNEKYKGSDVLQKMFGFLKTKGAEIEGNSAKYSEATVARKNKQKEEEILYGKKEDRVPISMDGKLAVEPSKPISEMDSQELYDYAQQVKEALKTNKNEDVIDNVADLKDISTKVNFVENSENINDLANSIKSAVRNMSKENPSDGSLAILNAAKKKAAELEISPKKLISEVLKKTASDYADKNDAEFAMKNALDKLTSKSENKPTVKSEEVPKEKIKAFRGTGRNVKQGENDSINWVAEDRRVAENYSSEGKVEEVEIEKPSNPFEMPANTIYVSGSDIGNRLRTIRDRLFKDGKITREQGVEINNAIKDFEQKAGDELELYSTKTNKKEAASSFVNTLKLLGFDGVIQKESYDSGSPFTNTVTGNESVTYGLFKESKSENKPITQNEGTTGKVNEPIPTNEGQPTGQGTETKVSASSETVKPTTTTPTATILKGKEKRIEDFNKKADNVGKSIIDLLTPAHTKGIKKSGLGVEEIVNTAIAAIKAANVAGENIKEAIETAIKYIKDNLGTDWDDNFEQPLRDRFKEISDNEPPTGESVGTSKSDSGKPKMRSVYKNIIERSKLPEKQKKLLRDDPQALYEVLPNDKAKAIALQIVEEMGVENAVAEASRSTSGLEPFEKVMILGAAMDHYSGLAKQAEKSNNSKDANSNADLEIDAQEKMQQAAQELAKLGTSLGRGINMFNEVYKLSNIALERKIKKQVNELNKLLKPQTDVAVSVVKDIIEDDSVTGIGDSMTDADAQQMADLKARVTALEKEIADLKKQVAANANAPAGSKKNPLNIVRKTNTTEYAKRLKEFAQRHRTGLNKDDLSDLTYFGLYHIENGVTKFGDWFGLMSTKFSKFKEYLRDTYLSAKDTAIQNGADATLFDNEDGIDSHLQDLQDKSDAKKMAQLTKRKAIAENNRANENNPAQARKDAPRKAAERIRNDAARNLGMLTTKNEQTYLKKLITTIQTKAREYYKEQKENISNVNDILAFAIANGKSDYAIWERTQTAVENQIDEDENLSDEEKEEVKGFLSDYTESIFETLLTGRQQEEIIRQKLIDAGYSTERTVNGKVVKAVDWNKVVGSAKNIKEAKAAIKKAILDVGFTEEEAKNEIDAVLTQFDNKVLEKKQTAINNYLKKGVINKVKSALGIGNTKTKIQKLVDMNNKGILDDSRIKEVLAKDLGIISLSDADLKKIRELTTLIDNPKIPSFQKKKYEEQLQYLFDSKGGNLTYLEFREFLANNRLTSMYNNIQNMTGWFRAISTYITVAIKTGSPIKTAKVFNKAFKESISDALTILLHGDVSRGTAFADLTRSTEGEPRVRYLEQGKGRLLGLPDAYVRVGKKAFNLNIFNTAYKGVKYVARVLESADTVPSNVISGLTQYWQIRKQLQFLHPELSSKQIEAKTYATMNGVGTAEASKEAMEGFNDAGIVPSKYQLNRAIHEINERNRNEQLNKEFYDTLETAKIDAEKRLIAKGNPTPTGEEITKEAYLILGRDEPLDVVARGERQALRETGKKSTFGLAGLVLWPLNALNQGLKKGMLANHTNTERWVINSGDAAITFLLPYANSIGRWIEMGIELTPYGVLKGLSYKSGAANLFEGLREGKITKEELSELGDDYIIRGVQGSSVLLGAMYLMSLLNGGGDDDDEEVVDVTGTYKNPNFPKEKIQSVGKPDQTLTVKGHKIPLGLMGNAAYPLIMYQDFLDKRTNDNEKHGILYTTAAVYLATSAQSVQSRLGAYGGIFSGIQSGKEDRYLPQLGKVVGSNLAASTIPFNRLQQEVGQLWNPKSEQSLTFGENLLQQFSIVGALGKAHPSFDYRGREYDFGEVFTGSADGIVKMFEKSKRADRIDRKLAEIDFGATDAFRESKDEENYKYTITDKEGNNRFMTTTEYYDFRKATAQKFNEKITKNFDIVDKLSIKVKDKVDENLTKETMNDTYSDMLTTAKEQALELVQAKTGFIPSKKAMSRIEKKENKSILKQKKRQLKRLDYED